MSLDTAVVNDKTNGFFFFKSPYFFSHCKCSKMVKKYSSTDLFISLPLKSIEFILSRN